MYVQEFLIGSRYYFIDLYRLSHVEEDDDKLRIYHFSTKEEDGIRVLVVNERQEITNALASLKEFAMRTRIAFD